MNRWGEYTRTLNHHVLIFGPLLTIFIAVNFLFLLFEIISFISIKELQNIMGFTMVFLYI